MRLRLVFIFSLLASVALAQNGVAVKQSGNVTPNQVPWWITSGVIGGGVTSADSPISSFGVTNNGLQGLCVNSDRITAAGRNTMCFGVKTAGGPAQITVQNFGTAAALGFQYVIDGTTITPAGGITALTVGSTTVGNGTLGCFLYNSPLGTLGCINYILTGTKTFFLNGDAVNPQPCGVFTCQPGNDSNNCLTIATPCRTIQHTLTYVTATYNFGAQGVVVQAAKGTYNECVNLPPYLSTNPVDKQVFLQGNSTVSDVTVSCSSGNTFSAINAPQGWVLKNLTVTASNICVFSDYKGSIYWDGGNFSGCTNFDVSAVNSGAFVEFVNHPYSASDSPACHVNTADGGQVAWNSVTANIIGGPTYSLGLLCVQKNIGIIDDSGLTISGSFSGPKYAVQGLTIFFSSGITALTPNSTQYVGLGSVSSSLINYFPIPFPTAGFVDLWVQTTAAAGAGQSYTVTVQFSGVNSLLTCTISGASATSCTDQNHLGFPPGPGTVATGTITNIQVVSSVSAAAVQISASMIQHN